MTNWEFLHLHTHQGHRRHERLREDQLLQHALIRQLLIELLRIDKQHQQAVTARQTQMMIHLGDALLSLQLV